MIQVAAGWVYLFSAASLVFGLGIGIWLGIHVGARFVLWYARGRVIQEIRSTATRELRNVQGGR